MNSSVRGIALFVILGGITATIATRSIQEPQPPPLPAPPSSTTAKPHPLTEEQWIVEDVVNAIAGMALESDSPSAHIVHKTNTGAGSVPEFRVAVNGVREPLAVVITQHAWAAETYVDIARQLAAAAGSFAAPREDYSDLAVRSALTDLRAETLLDVNQRISAALEANLRSGAAHESAALLVGSFALRESVGMFADLRPALSRMAAHLAMAQALRQSGDETLDGTLARAILTALSGLQRQALTIVEQIDRRSGSAADRAWVRALRLRITGDWRNAPRPDGETRIERLEYARAIRLRRGIDAFLDYLDTFPPDEAADWHRIAFHWHFNVEAGHRFAKPGVVNELAEARLAWSRFHTGEIDDAGVVRALNERPARSPVQRLDNKRVVQVIDWGTWAAFHQRHLCHMLTAVSYHLWQLSDKPEQDALAATLERPFGELTLYPVVLRWVARTPAEYEQAMKRARPLVNAAPELLTAAMWNYLLAESEVTGRAERFPVATAWFTPPVPTGTAFDLGSRSLRSGCPRPPSREQAATWAREMPYDHWTQWANAFFAMDSGAPSLSTVRRAFGPLMEYDESALYKSIEHLDLSPGERIGLARPLCHVSSVRCAMLAELLLLQNHEVEAVRVYEKWVATARDEVSVANELLWLTRYYIDHGNPSRAEALARRAADTGSATGLEILGELLDRTGRHDEAESYYRMIEERYAKHATPLGTFLMRKALRTHDSALEVRAGELLQETFPTGLQRIVIHALPAKPVDGVIFKTFGTRASAAGLQPNDVIVGIDDWRVHNVPEYKVTTRLSHDATMKLTVWRNGRYRQLQARVPQRWFGVRFKDFAVAR
jgi:tetratricopeptide (TPR) repeat protein